MTDLERQAREAGQQPDADPWWLTEAIHRLAAAPTPSPSAYPPELLFLPLAAPLIEPHRQHVRSVLDTCRPTRARSDALLTQAFRRLAEQVNDMLARSVVLDLHSARIDGQLEGATSEARYRFFAARFHDAGFRLEFFGRYPVLARQLLVAARNWEEATRRVIERLAADQELLDEWQDLPSGSRELVEITTGAGDRHRGGQTVTKLRFTDGSRLIYKPRPAQLDLAFGNLVHWLNTQPVKHRLGAVPTVTRGDYSWQVEILFARCSETDAAAAERFYYRQGGLLALLYLLSGSDVHYENLICTGDVPYLVDLESLCQPELALTDVRLSASEQAIIDLTTDSVLRVGLLPSQSAVTPGGPAADISGLGGHAGQQTNLKLPTLVDVGTDRMRIELDYGQIEDLANQPLAGDVTTLLTTHVDDIVEGFDDVHRTFEAHKDWLLNDAASPLRGLQEANVRVLARHTAYYGVIHVSSFHPDVLRDSTAREKHYDFLRHETANMPALQEFVAHERADLWNNDIPLFSTPISTRIINSSTGDRIEGLLRRSGIECLNDRIGSLSESGRRRQVWLIRTSVAVAAVNAASALTYPFYTPPEFSGATGAPSPEALLGDAERIGMRLVELSFEREGAAEWLGVNSRGGTNWALGPLGPDLYHGLTGVSVFLAALARLSAESRFERLARAAMRTAEQQVERGMLNLSNGMSGLPGYLWGRVLAGTLLGDPAGELAVPPAIIDRLRDAIEADQEWDVNGGSAGTILCLSGLPRAVVGKAIIRELVGAAARRLVEAQGPRNGGWAAQTMVTTGLATAPLAGLAHGAAGICWALTIAGRLIDDAAIGDAVARGLSYERSLYVPEWGNWRDMRDQSVLGTPGEAPLLAWCHGASGIALARTGMLDDSDERAVREEIEVAVEATLRASVGQNHSLCHGDLGNLEIVALAADRLDRPDWHRQADEMLAQAVEGGRRHGWLSGMPTGVEAPGFMTGLAGIGYALLRAGFPAEIPSVLSLDGRLRGRTSGS